MRPRNCSHNPLKTRIFYSFFVTSSFQGNKNQQSILYAIISNIFEAYCYTLYIFSSPVLVKLFFKTEHQLDFFWELQLIFLSAFIMRPIGAIYLGALSDKFGRKKNLLISTLLFTLPTLIISLLPSYSVWGPLSSVILILCRMIQGLGLAARESGTVTFVKEHSTLHQEGLNSSLINASSLVGTFIAAILSAACLYFEMEGIERLPFIIGALFGYVAFLLRQHLIETDDFKKILKNKEIVSAPLITAFQEHKIHCLRIFGVSGIVLGPFYISMMYANTRMHAFYHLEEFEFMLLNSVIILILIFIIPLFGFISDYVGTIKTMNVGIWGFILSAYPIFYCLHDLNSLKLFMSAQTLLIIFGAMCAAPSNAVVASLLPPNQRSSGVSFSYSLGLLFFGPLTPLILSFLEKIFKGPLLPTFYFIILCLIGLFSLKNIKNHHDPHQKEKECQPH